MTREEWDEINEPLDQLVKWLRKPGRERERIHISQGTIEIYDIYEAMPIESAKEMSDQLRNEVLATNEETILGFSKRTLLQYIAAAKTAIYQMACENEGEHCE